jgi:hypothetical protein
MTAHPEIELLICCARTHLDPATREKIRILVAKDIDWAYLIRKAWRQGIAPLLYRGLSTTLPRAIPSWALDTLRSAFYANAARNLFLSGELITLMDLFDSHAIPAMPYKGPVLAVSVYHDLALRQFSDLDILIHAWDFHFRAQDLLVSHGWRRISDYGWESGFVDESGRVALDLHQGITGSGMPFNPGFERLWKRRASYSLAGTLIPTFAPSDGLIILCAQLAKDAGTNRVQLAKLCDIAELVRDQASLDWDWTIDEARRFGVLHIVFLGLRAVNEVLDVTLPDRVLGKIHAVPKLASVVTHIKECLSYAAAGRYSRPELLTRSRFHSEVRERLRDRLDRKYAYAITPNVFDYRFVRLPRSLFFLYHVVRPIRLFFKYGRELLRRLLVMPFVNR